AAFPTAVGLPLVVGLVVGSDLDFTSELDLGILAACLLEALLAQGLSLHLAARPGVAAAAVAAPERPMVGVQVQHRFLSSNHPVAPFETRIHRARVIPEPLTLTARHLSVCTYRECVAFLGAAVLF